MERISPLATRSQHTALARIDRMLLEAKVGDARRNDRLREIHCFHESDGEPLHRMLNAMEPGTYVRPHRHSSPPKAESVVILRGRMGMILFDEHGSLLEEESLELSRDGDVVGVDLRPGVWHTMLALESGTVIFEVKPGPYQRADDKDFASWAPRENTAEAAAYLRKLEERFRRVGLLEQSLSQLS